MKQLTFTSKRQSLLAGLCCTGILLMAQTKTVNLTESGTLADLLGTEQASITDLTVTTAEGVALDTTDFKTLAAMPKLKTLDLSGDLNTTLIGPANVFSGNTTLETIKFPANLQGFDPGAFNGAALKGELIIPATVTNPAYFTSRLDNLQGVTAFRVPDATEASAVRDIDGAIIGWGNSLMKYPCGNTQDTYEMPEGITAIMQQAFGDNHHLKKLVLSTTVESFQNIGATFRGSDALEAIEVKEGNTNFTSMGGILAKQDTKELYFFPPANQTENLVIDGTKVERMANNFFSNAVNLKRVVFTEGFKQISYSCFKMGSEALQIEYIELPSTIDTIGGEAFVGLKTMTQLICKATTPPYINGRQVLREANGEDFRMGVPAEAVEAYRASAWNNSLSGTPEGYEFTYADINGCPGDQIIAYRTITMQGGTASSDVCIAGYQVEITADEAPEGSAFSGWTSDPAGVSFVNTGATNTYFTMPDHDVTIIANFATAQPYTIIGATGSQSGYAGVGSMVNLETAPTRVIDGVTYYFVEWRVNKGEGIVIENPQWVNTSFIMVDGEVEIEAIYQAKYMVNITGGDAVIDAFEGETVTVTALKPQGKKFTGWTAEEDDVVFADATAETTTFVMPAHDVNITANFEDEESGVADVQANVPVLYPNPATESIRLLHADHTAYTIYNVSGQAIIHGITNGEPIAVDQLPNGTYLFKMGGNVTSFIKK